MGEDQQCVDPLRFTISGEQFFCEVDVSFSVDDCCRMMRGPFDVAVDALILEVFLYVASIASDSCFRRPAVDVAAEWVR
jgi:hypothetical protein